jgi:hypothetical protein
MGAATRSEYIQEALKGGAEVIVIEQMRERVVENQHYIERTRHAGRNLEHIRNRSVNDDVSGLCLPL